MLKATLALSEDIKLGGAGEIFVLLQSRFTDSGVGSGIDFAGNLTAGATLADLLLLVETFDGTFN